MKVSPFKHENMTSFIDFHISYSEKGPNLNMESKTIAVNNHVKSLLIHKNPFQAKTLTQNRIHTHTHMQNQQQTSHTKKKLDLFHFMFALYVHYIHTNTLSVLTHICSLKNTMSPKRTTIHSKYLSAHSFIKLLLSGCFVHHFVV